MCAPRQFQQGLSLIELMVSIVVALLLVLAATSVSTLFTALQRQGIGAGGASISAATTLSALKEDVGLAGLGFFGEGTPLCTALNLRVGARDLSQAEFSPLTVTREGADDRIDVVYATDVAGGAAVPLKSASDLTSAELETFLPIAAGSVTAAFRPTVLLAPPVTGVPCTVRSVTDVQDFTEALGQRLTFSADGLHNAGGAFASPAQYAARSRVALLGSLQWHRYRLDGGVLRLDRPMAVAEDERSVVLARNVVAFRARIGVTPGAVADTAIDAWVAPDVLAPSGHAWGRLAPSDFQRVRALEVSIVIRGAQPEKPDADGGCDATAEPPKVFDEPIAPSDVGGVSWQCFRYRAASVIVPLRNWAWGLRP